MIPRGNKNVRRISGYNQRGVAVGSKNCSEIFIEERKQPAHRMESQGNLLAIGLIIKIKRSDGRVHDATVSGIDTGKNLVSVEWFEGEETKGKEIELSHVLYLNPNITTKPVTPKVIQSKLQPPRRQTNITPHVSNSGIPKPQSSRLKNVENIMMGAGHSKQAVVPPGHPPMHSSSDEQPHQHKKENPSAPLRMVVSRSKSSGSLSAKQQQKEQQQKEQEESNTVQRRQKSQNRNTSNRHSQYGGVPVPPSNQAPVSKDQSKDKGGANRISQVVKEVDVIKKKRDERRVKNAELRQKKREDYDPDNPNWEFAGMVRDFRQGININPLRTCEEVINDRICVCVRKRPLSKKELSRKETDIITIPEQSLTMVHEPKTKVDLTKYLEHHNFRFDYSFDEAATNEMIYHYSAKSLVDTIFDQGMATCFAYGQTGSGKTHTMGGSFNGKEQDSTRGIYALAAADVFRLNRVSHGNLGLVVSASYFEIYCSKVFDLLNGKKRLRILEDARSVVQVVGLLEESVSSVADVLQLIETGNRIRTSGTTSANQNSSRSHAVFQLILRKKSSGKLHGKLSLIDLAGNERGADTSSSDRKTRLEGAEINKSLLALKECIRALGRKGVHLPFRGSTLTQVLRDSFIGPKARTCMISTISPGLNCCEHTLNTLRYAERVKELPGKRHPQPANIEPQQSLHQSSTTNDRSKVTPPTNVNVPDDEYEEEEEEMITDEVDPMDSEFECFEKSSELQNFHEVLSQLNDLEEMLFTEHREIIQDTKAEEELLLEAEGVDGNTEEYTQKMIQLIDDRINKLGVFRAHLKDYQNRLSEEEAASQLLKNARR